MSDTLQELAILLIALIAATIIGFSILIWTRKRREQRRLREHFRAKKSVVPPRSPPN